MKDGDREAAVKVSCEIPALLLLFSRHGPRWRRRCRCRGCRCRWLRRRIAAHAVLEFAHALPQALHHFRNLLPAEKDKYHSGDDQKMHWAVKHRNLPFAPGRPRQAPQTYHIRRLPPPKSTSTTTARIKRRIGMSYIETIGRYVAARPPGAPNPSIYGYSITRSSPARRVTCSRSRCSSSGIAYFRLIPASSLNAVIGRRLPFSLLYFASSPRSCASASR